MNGLTDAKIKSVANRLGYKMTRLDCSEIRRTSPSKSETTFDAVTDYLNAFETCIDFGGRRKEFVK